MSSRFDRVRPRTADPDGAVASHPTPAPADVEGKRVLFSATAPGPQPNVTLGTVTIECSSCGADSALTLAQWARATIPSLHIPLPGRRFPSYMRCPACSRRTWVRPHFRV